MKPILDLEPDECRYAVTETTPFMFCAEPKQDGSSYCAEHHAICFRYVREGARGSERPLMAAIMRKARVPAVLQLQPEIEA